MKIRNITILISLLVIISTTACSLLVDEYSRRVGFNSICWEDDDHILVYANIWAFNNYTNVGGQVTDVVWTGGELWRIDVNTGEKELLLRKKGDKYAFSSFSAVDIRKYNDNYYINDLENTYIMNNDCTDWEYFVDCTFINFTDNDTKLLAYKDNEIVKYNIADRTFENICQIDFFAESMEYSSVCDVVFMSGRFLVDLDTGQVDTLIDFKYVFNGETVYTYYGKNSEIRGNELSLDLELDNGEYSKLYMDLNDLDNCAFNKTCRGKLSPDGEKGAYIFYASAGQTEIDIITETGTVISSIIFERAQL